MQAGALEALGTAIPLAMYAQETALSLQDGWTAVMAEWWRAA